MQIQSILHASMIVSDVQVALDFYCGVLGLEVDENRPDLGYPGAWLNVGDQKIHLLMLDNPDPVEGRPLHGGRDRHTALAVCGLDVLCQRLDDAGVQYTRSRSGRNALFCRDSDGNTLEFIEDA